MTGFKEFGLPAVLEQSLEYMQYTTPTPIQAEAIPPALLGKDIIGSAQTGTGKTAAFALPLIASLLNNSRGSALVLTPTRELAVQVMDVVQKLVGRKSPIKTALLIGGEPMPKQLAQLKLRPRIIVGTPGRVNDHLKRGTAKLHDGGFLVLDETDRMLDMGFSIQIDEIVKYLPKVRQTLMFSATFPDNIVKFSQKYLIDPVRVAIGEQSKVAANIQQDIIHISTAEKHITLLQELERREGSVIIFVKTKRGADKLAEKLLKAEHHAQAIHGDLRQNQRDRVINAFRNRKYRILVATDIAARGLDIPHIEHVINYDLPQCPEDYIHRIGRTARAGAEGASLCLVSPEEKGKWKAIHRMMNPDEAAKDRESEARNSNGGARRGRSRGGRRPFGNDEGRKSFGNGEGRRSFGNGEGRRSSGNDEGRKSFGNGEGRKPFGNDEGRRSSGNDEGRKPFGNDESRRSSGNGEGRKPFGNDESRRSSGNGEGRKPFGNDESRRSSGNGEGRKPFGNDEGRRSSGNGEGRRSSGNGEGRKSFGNGEGRKSFGNGEGKKSFGGGGFKRRKQKSPRQNAA